MSLLRVLLRSVLILGLIFSGLGLITVLIPLSGFRKGQGSHRVRNFCTRVWSRGVCLTLGVRIRCHGEPMTEAGLTVANHISWLDIMILASLGDYVFVAKQEVADWPLLGRLFQGVGTLFIRRGHREDSTRLAKIMTQYLQRGLPLLLFPEATTTTGETVRRFGGKLFQPAHLSQSLIQPVAIGYAAAVRDRVPFVGDMDFLGHLMRLMTLKFIDVDLHFLAPISAERPADELAISARQAIRSALNLSPRFEPRESQPEPESGTLPNTG